MGVELAMNTASRREFSTQTIGLGTAAILSGPFRETSATAADPPGGKFQVGLCTYLWGKDWDLPTVIANCEKSKVLAVELRTAAQTWGRAELECATASGSEETLCQ